MVSCEWESAVTAIPAPFVLHFHESIGSTSDEAKALAVAGAPHGTVVVAREQTEGRGRLQRRWLSPKGNLHLSVVLRPEVEAARATELGFMATLAVAEAVEAFLPPGMRAKLKWPNDVLVNGAKIAGILPETELSGSGIAWVVLGAGINVAHRPLDTPYPATSLVEAGSNVPSPDPIVPILLTRIASWWDVWTQYGFAAVRQAWLERAHRLGELIEVRIGDSPVRARFAGLDRDGALLLDTPGGRRRITAGEVAFGAGARNASNS